nr:hypothetical protein HK105_005377 [Polyrhizophydium stewartii]
MDERNLQSSGRGRLKQPQTVKSLKPSKTVRVAREAISIAVAAIDSRGPASPASPTSPLIATGAAPKKSRFNWALYFVALQAVQTAVVLALQGLVIYRVVQFSFAALNELKNDPSLVVTYASIFIIANCAVLGMTFYAVSEYLQTDGLVVEATVSTGASRVPCPR